MSAKVTWLLIMLVLLVGGGIVLLEREVPKTRERLVERERLLAFDLQALDHVEVRFAEGRTLVLARGAGGWRVAEPFDDVADPERVQRLLEELAGLEVLEEVREKEMSAENWQQTGFDKPFAKVRLMAGSQRLREFWVGAEAGLERSLYLSVAGDKADQRRFLMVRSELVPVLSESAALWRDMKLLRLEAEEVTALRLRRDDVQLELVRETGSGGKPGWRLLKPLRCRASDEALTELLETLLNLRVVKVEDPILAATTVNGAGAAVSEEGGLKVEVEAGERRYELVFGQRAEARGEDELLEVRVSHRKSEFEVMGTALGRLWWDPNDLRDDHLARVAESAVSAFGLVSQSFPEVQVRRENDLWLLNRLGRWQPANGDRVGRFFETLNESLLLEFTADAAADLGKYGLDDPFLKVWWEESSGDEGAAVLRRELSFGQGVEVQGFYVKAADEPFVNRVSGEIFTQLPADGLKWKGRGVLRFSLFDLKRVMLVIGAAPPIRLDYAAESGSWSGRVGDEDITHLIDRVKADALAGALARLSADDWSAAIAEGLEALKEPAVRIQVTLQEAGSAAGKERVLDLKFAPTVAGQDTAFYYGRLNEEPDVFYLTREALRGLLRPVLLDVK